MGIEAMWLIIDIALERMIKSNRKGCKNNYQIFGVVGDNEIWRNIIISWDVKGKTTLQLNMIKVVVGYI